MKNTFYVIRLPDTAARPPKAFYDSHTGCSASSLAGAQRHATVNAAALRLHALNDLWSKNAEILRVEETPGVEQRVLLGETEEAPKGATVKYTLLDIGDQYLVDLSVSMDGIRWSDSITNARLFRDQGSLFTHVADDRGGECSAILGGTVKLVRIALIPGTPTVTETVLA